MHNVRVRDVMTRDPATCRSTDTASEAARIMWDRDCGAVPVIDAQGRAIGMVTDRDLCMAAYLRGVRLEELTVESVMAPAAITCIESDRLDAAGKSMAEARVRRLPVTNADGIVCGMLSINDIVRARAKGARDVDGVVATLALIGEPRRREIAEAE